MNALQIKISINSTVCFTFKICASDSVLFQGATYVGNKPILRVLGVLVRADIDHRHIPLKSLFFHYLEF